MTERVLNSYQFSRRDFLKSMASIVATSILNKHLRAIDQAFPTFAVETAPDAYKTYFLPETDLSYTSGVVNWAKPLRLLIPPAANLFIKPHNHNPVEFFFNNDYVIHQLKDLDISNPAAAAYGHWWQTAEKTRVYSGRPYPHPLIEFHSGTFPLLARIFPGEYLRRAQDFRQNPLLGKSWFIEQAGETDGVLRRSEYQLIHTVNLPQTKWKSILLFQADKQVFADFHLSTLSDSTQPGRSASLFPLEAQQPHQITFATCHHDSLTFGTFKLIKIITPSHPENTGL